MSFFDSVFFPSSPLKKNDQGIALAAGAASARRALPGSSHTYGHHRAEVLGALASTAATWAVTAALAVAAVGRLRKPERVDGKLMFFMAITGVFVNVLLLLVLGGAHGHGGHSQGGGHSHSHSHSHSLGGGGGDESHYHHHDDHSHSHDDDDEEQGVATTPLRASRRHAASTVSINLRGAWLHAAGDLLQSVGVAIAGAVVYFKPSWTLADPLVTLLFAVLVFATTRKIAGELLAILMEAAPARVDVASLERVLRGIRGVTAVGDLHVWGLSSGIALGTAHLSVSGSSSHAGVLAAAKRAMEAHGVAHSTIQVEKEEGEEGEEGGGV